MSTDTLRIVYHFLNSTLHILVFDRPQGYVLYYSMQIFQLLPYFYQAMSDKCSKDSHLFVYAKIHSLFLQSVIVNQRSCSLLLFFHRESHCYHQLITPQLKGFHSLLPWA